MPTCVVICLNDDGQVLVGEISPDSVNPDELQPAQTFEEAAESAKEMLLGDHGQGDEEDAFNQTVAAQDKAAMKDKGGY